MGVTTTATLASGIEVTGMLDRLHNAVEVLSASLRSGDGLSARYAAATITCLGDMIETALLTATRP
jgi:hypothetical protein